MTKRTFDHRQSLGRMVGPGMLVGAFGAYLVLVVVLVWYLFGEVSAEFLQ